ncbi:uncharacterized protein LOC113557710 [Rhopalosiphum maidis]|uniref:uncharacterized protein LOC113557710 n=1 Tax=Rhopalosiphum maidis TaxID=43146 RepID=UPI000EFFF617|nr:uncharacterized protein LOC113557710 [Rhopalosiphum maidis]
MLLRNLHPPKLCNGTRLCVETHQNNIIEATITLQDVLKENQRLPLLSSNYPFEFKILQFPIMVSFAMTINKLQGQFLKIAGIDLSNDCFSHMGNSMWLASEFVHLAA